MEDTPAESQPFSVKLDLFDGPLDLLLHLVKQNELPIEKLSLAAVADQYLSCIEAVQDFDIELAGEYLVIAATLLSIKSSVLLNEPVECVTDEDGNLVDPHEELLRKLREAAIYRDSATELARRSLLGFDVFPPPGALDDVDEGPIVFMDHSPTLLGKAFRRLLAKVQEPLSLNITYERISIVDRMMAILDLLAKIGGPVPFERLVPDVTNRSSIIASFVALLELCKRNLIAVKQDENFDQIVIVRRDGTGVHEPLSSEFDVPANDSAAADISASG